MVLLPCEETRFLEGEIQGEIAFFDHFGNIETNIPAAMAEHAGLAGKELILSLGERTYLLRYTTTYGVEKKGALTVHPDSSGFLEIAVTQGNARETLQAQAGMKITLKRAFQKPSPGQDTPL